MKPAPAVNCEWTNCPRRVGDVCCNDRPAADNASLRADNVRLQNEVVGPLRERVKVLEDVLQRVRNDKSFHCLKIEKTQQYIIAALGDNNADPD